ncbi:MAG: DODA-type extradiol aromatic ring-opening family dioxygenase [Candidatus Hermodarchaeota archaeon]
MASPRTPAVFIGHGAPLNIIWETNYRTNLQKFAKSITQPLSILIVSAHWEQNIPLQVTSASQPKIIYDYYGFPEEMYQIQYNPPGNAILAKKIVNTLNTSSVTAQFNDTRGLDHGAWIPLKIMYPEANIPLLQLSIPIPRNSKKLFKIGQILSDFRKEGVMLLGSGNLVHNLSHVFQQMRMGKFDFSNWSTAPEEKWAKETDDWIKEQLNNNNFDDLLDSINIAPHFRYAAPTTEHFDPLYFVLGSLDKQEGITYIHEGFEGGSISMRCFTAES